MRERYVVDTNVLIAASAADPLTQKDWDATPKEVVYQRQVHEWMTSFEASSASWVLDGQGQIEAEYRRRLSHPDYALLVLQYKWDTQAVHYVAVEYDSDGHGRLTKPLQSLVHDRADRKMVAAALEACQAHEPCAIAFAGDTDWHDWEDGLQEAGLCLEPIIPEWSGPKHRDKSKR